MRMKQPLRKAAGNTLLRYFLSYFIIFSVLITGFFYIIRTQLSRLYLDQLTAQSMERLGSLTETLLDEIISLDAINNSMRGNMNIITARYTTDEWHQYQAYHGLMGYTTGQPYINSIVYLNKNRNLVTSTYIRTEYVDGVFRMYSPSGSIFTFDPAPYQDGYRNQLLYFRDGDAKYLIYFPVSTTYANHITFFVINTTEISQLCRNTASSEMPAIALTDPDGNIIAGTGTDMLLPYLDILSHTDGICPVDNQTSLCVNRDFGQGYAMVSLISNQELLDRANTAFRTAYLVLFGLGIAGLLLIWLSMRSTYLPLYKLTRKIVPSLDSRRSYFEQLDKSFAESTLKNRRLQEKLDKYKLSVQKSLLDTIVSSNQPGDSQGLPDIDGFFTMDEDNNIFSIKMKSPKMPFPWSKILDFFRHSLTSEDACVILESSRDTAVLLLNYTGPEPHKEEILQELLADLHTEEGCLSSISASSSSPLDIPSLYEQAVQAAGLWDRMPVVSFTESGSLLEADHALAYPYDSMGRLSAFLQSGQFREAEAVIEELFLIIDRSESTVRQIPDFFAHCILMDLLASIANAMEHSAIRFKSYSDLYFQALYHCRSCPYRESAALIREDIGNLLDFFREQQTSKSADTYQLKALIEASFTDPDFSIAQLADKFHFSIAYISYLVKKEVNQNFTDYLWKLRLDRAKELLQDTNQSIDEISVAVGYLNTSSFRRKFKQDMGMTPSQYREQESPARK